MINKSGDDQPIKPSKTDKINHHQKSVDQITPKLLYESNSNTEAKTPNEEQLAASAKARIDAQESNEQQAQLQALMTLLEAQIKLYDKFVELQAINGSNNLNDLMIEHAQQELKIFRSACIQVKSAGLEVSNDQDFNINYKILDRPALETAIANLANYQDPEIAEEYLIAFHDNLLSLLEYLPGDDFITKDHALAILNITAPHLLKYESNEDGGVLSETDFNEQDYVKFLTNIYGIDRENRNDNLMSRFKPFLDLLRPTTLVPGDEEEEEAQELLAFDSEDRYDQYIKQKAFSFINNLLKMNDFFDEAIKHKDLLDKDPFLKVVANANEYIDEVVAEAEEGGANHLVYMSCRIMAKVLKARFQDYIEKFDPFKNSHFINLRKFKQALATTRGIGLHSKVLSEYNTALVNIDTAQMQGLTQKRLRILRQLPYRCGRSLQAAGLKLITDLHTNENELQSIDYPSIEVVDPKKFAKFCQEIVQKGDNEAVANLEIILEEFFEEISYADYEQDPERVLLNTKALAAVFREVDPRTPKLREMKEYASLLSQSQMSQDFETVLKAKELDLALGNRKALDILQAGDFTMYLGHIYNFMTQDAECYEPEIRTLFKNNCIKLLDRLELTCKGYRGHLSEDQLIEIDQKIILDSIQRLKKLAQCDFKDSGEHHKLLAMHASLKEIDGISLDMLKTPGAIYEADYPVDKVLEIFNNQAQSFLDNFGLKISHPSPYRSLVTVDDFCRFSVFLKSITDNKELQKNTEVMAMVTEILENTDLSIGAQNTDDKEAISLMAKLVELIPEVTRLQVSPRASRLLNTFMVYGELLANDKQATIFNRQVRDGQMVKRYELAFDNVLDDTLSASIEDIQEYFTKQSKALDDAIEQLPDLQTLAEEILFITNIALSALQGQVQYLTGLNDEASLERAEKIHTILEEWMPTIQNYSNYINPGISELLLLGSYFEGTMVGEQYLESVDKLLKDWGLERVSINGQEKALKITNLDSYHAKQAKLKANRFINKTPPQRSLRAETLKNIKHQVNKYQTKRATHKNT